MKSRQSGEKIISASIFICLIVFIGANIIVRELNNLDEIWNFNFSNCVSKGMIPYRDFNMVQTPLLPLICGNILKIFGQELFIMRILAIILCSSVIMMMYKVLKKLKVKESINYILLTFSVLLMNTYFTIDYNWATLLVLLIIIYLEIPKKDENNEILKVNLKNDIIIGVLAGTCIMLKQSTGLLISIVTVGYKIFEIRNKGQIREFIKIAASRALGVCIPIALITIYLLINGALKDFIDYCILGVSTFSNKISYEERLINNRNINFRILSIMPIILIMMLALYFIKKERKFLILSLYGIAEFIVVYPISDESHFVIGICPTLISMIYLLNLILNKFFTNKNLNKKINYVISNTILTFAILITIFEAYEKLKLYMNLNINHDMNHYKLIPISEQFVENIKCVDDYIVKSQKNVYILDAQAAIYMIPIDRYNKDYDMFLKGNLGSQGEYGQIDKLKKEEEKIVLMLNENYNRNWQNPEEVRKFILMSMEKTGEIGIFSIYE